jgi:uncharacterized protein with PIN domain
MTIVLDASAMVALLRDQVGAALVESALNDGTNVCLAHAINLCEVYYDAVRERGEPAAQACFRTCIPRASSPGRISIRRSGRKPDVTKRRSAASLSLTASALS